MNEILEKSSHYYLMEKLENWIAQYSLGDTLGLLMKIAIALAAIALVAFISDFITRKVVVSSLVRFARKSKTQWDDFLIDRRVFHKLAHLVPAIVVYMLIPIALEDIAPVYVIAIQTITKAFMILIGLLSLGAFLDASNDVYLTLPVAIERPIKGYLQIAKIVAYFFGGIVIIALIVGKDPSNIVVGLGASAAVLMLVFKDTLLGFVASIQLSANDMVKIGDWIEMPSRKADGTVMEITLATVKVQNWDRTITTIPTYALVSESFTNWRGMEQSDGRRFKRAVLINISSVKFCAEPLLTKLRKVQILHDYIESKEHELHEYNLHEKIDNATMVNGRRLTNLGLFRKYIEFYLQNNPNVDSANTLMVRLLEPNEKGIPMEIYGFSKEKRWVQYESILGDIFDHLLAVVPEFELKVFQNPSGDDFKNLVNR
jgi:Small-conductance mechanosensitive channel